MKLRVLAAALILCAAAPALAQYGLTWETHGRGAAAGLLQLSVFHSDVINSGSATGTYHVAMTVDAPPAWVTSMCEGDYCYAPFVREFDFTLAPGDTNDIGANITPVTDLGGALVTLTVSSVDDPALTETRGFTVVTPGLDVLIVDADAGGDPVPLTAAALGALGKTSVAWAAVDAGAPDASVLAGYATVIWSTGADVGGLDEDARTALDAYALQGGHVWLNGANLAFGQCSPGSPAWSAASQAWCRDVAGLDWVSLSAATDQVSGVVGDELGDGLALELNGGDSAGNNAVPDVIAAAGGGTACLTYGTGGTAAVRRVWGAGRIVTTAFSLEGVRTAAERADLAGAVLGWYVGGASAVGDVPALAEAPRAVPNPFNPRTVISFAVAGTASRPVTVTVHDLRGRLVRRLLDDTLAPGPHAVAWDGRDDGGRGLAAGLYLARVHAGADRATVKMTLAK